MDCGLSIYGSGSKKSMMEAQEAHICNSVEKYCPPCERKHDPNSDCKLKITKFTNEYPKLCFITGAISDPSNFDCLTCHSILSTNEKCQIHKNLGVQEPYCNFLYTLREVWFHQFTICSAFLHSAFSP